jgi:hypothetical protein
MAHSYQALYVHLVFGTTDRQRFLTDPIVRPELHINMGRTCKRLSRLTFSVGSFKDHGHVLELKETSTGRHADFGSAFIHKDGHHLSRGRC